jgi:hypothetical protein
MPENNVPGLITLLLSGGATGVVALLILVITGLLWDRRRVFMDNEKKDKKLDLIMEHYYSSNAGVTDALSSIKIVLAEISVKLIK